MFHVQKHLLFLSSFSVPWDMADLKIFKFGIEKKLYCRIFRKVELRNYKIKVNNLFKTSTEIRIKSTIDQTCFRSQSCLLLKLLSYRGLSTWALIILIRSLFLESKSVGVFECGSGSSALWSLTNIVNQSYHPVT